MNLTNVDWADYSWSPCVGCYGPGGTAQHPAVCSYCYAKRFAERGLGEYGLHPVGGRFTPRFFPERLNEPGKIKKPSRIFVCSMSDLFGCYDDQTEVLTKQGWKLFSDVVQSDEVAYLDPESNELRYSVPLSITRYPYRGKMYHVKTKLVDLQVTSNHKLYVAHRPSTLTMRRIAKHGAYSLEKASDVLGKAVYYKRDFVWNGQECDTLMGMPAKHWLAFLGLWLAEGNASLTGGHHRRIQIASAPNNSERPRIAAIVARVGEALDQPIHDYRDRLVMNGNTPVFEYLRQFGHAHEKFIPAEVKALSKDLLEVLIDGLMLGDGSRPPSGLLIYHTASKRLADDVQEIAAKCGYVASVVVGHPAGREGGRLLNGRLIKQNYPDYVVIMSTHCREPEVNMARIRSRARRSNRQTNCTEEWVDYDGDVFCVEVPSHILYVRRNGHAVWCGNSWVPRYWITQILETVKACPQHTFIFLTKNPKRYLQFVFPVNAWIGVTAEDDRLAAERMPYLQRVNASVKFVSFEPLLEAVDFLPFWPDWIIVGAQTGPNAIKPQLVWCKKLIAGAQDRNIPLFLKENLLKLYPELDKIQQIPGV